MFTHRIHAAFGHAADCHAKQRRKGTQIPYLSHLLGVASLVMEAAADGEAELSDDYEDLVIAGLLHDAVEDCGGKPVLAEIREKFGERVAAIVAHCTDAMPAEGEEKPLWAPRKEAYLAHLERTDDYGALLVSAADKLHNTRAIVTDLRTYARKGYAPADFWQRFVADKPDADLKARVPEILGYYRALADVISRKAAEEAKASPTDRLARLAAELESAVAEMLRFAGAAGFAARWPIERVSAETS